MSINEYVQAANNTIRFSLVNFPATANTALVTTTNNPAGTAYISSTLQGTSGGSIFNVYLCLSAAVSLVVNRYVLSQAYISLETFPVEVAGQPNWHSLQVSPFDQINFQLSGPATINIMRVMEPKPV